VNLHKLINTKKFEYIKLSCEYNLDDDIELDEHNYNLIKIQEFHHNSGKQDIKSEKIQELVNRNVNIKNRLHLIHTKALVQ